jgi:hypothetical protein
MIVFDKENEKLHIHIPLNGYEELLSYQRSILGVLSEIEIQDCKPELKEHLKKVYCLLSHLLMDSNLNH